MRLRVFKALGLLVVVMLGLLLCSRARAADLAPDFTFTDVNGRQLSLSGFRGSVVILDFFGIKCSPCMTEMGYLKTVHGSFGNDLWIISISVDGEPDDQVRQYKDDNGIPWIVARDPGVWKVSYTGTGVPSLFIVDQAGYLSYPHPAEVTPASVLIGEVQSLLAPLTVASERTVIGQGIPLRINLTVRNQGDSPVTFNTTVNASNTTNTMMVGTRLVDLTSGESATISFSWDTTGIAYGNYSISACAQPVSGGTTRDDNLTDPIMVGIPGDVVQLFGRIDMKDVAYVAKRFSTDPLSSLWDPNADINGDVKVDMKDIAIVAKNFGKHSP